MSVEAKKYGTTTVFDSEMEDRIVGGLDVIKAQAVRSWHAQIERLGYVPYGEPEARVHRTPFLMSDVDPETGEEFMLPDSCCIVTGSVLPKGAPIPEGVPSLL